MLDFYQKRKLQVVLGSRWMQGVLVLTTLLVAWSAFTRYQIAMEMSDRRTEVEQEAAALEVRKTDLQMEVDYLSDERGIEAEMRRQFDVAKEGEKVVVIVDPEEEEETVSEIQPETESTTNKRWYQFWR